MSKPICKSGVSRLKWALSAVSAIAASAFVLTVESRI